MTVGERLRDLRHRRSMDTGEDLTQPWLAKEVGASKSSVAKWETDAQPPGPKFLPRLARVYGVSVEYILTGEGEEKGEVGSTRRYPPPSLGQINALQNQMAELETVVAVLRRALDEMADQAAKEMIEAGGDSDDDDEGDDGEDRRAG